MSSSREPIRRIGYYQSRSRPPLKMDIQGPESRSGVSGYGREVTHESALSGLEPFGPGNPLRPTGTVHRKDAGPRPLHGK